MPRRRLTRAESKAQTLQRVLEAADRVFIERGFVATSVDEIAERAGYSKGAVYASFPNKASLFLAVSTQHLRRDALELFAQVRHVEHGEDIPGVMASWFQTQIARDTPRVLMEAEFWLVAARDEGSRQAASDFLELSRRTVEALVREQTERLEVVLPLDPATIAAAAIALRHGLALQSWFDTAGNEASVFATSTAALLGLETPRAQAKPSKAKPSRTNSTRTNSTRTGSTKTNPTKTNPAKSRSATAKPKRAVRAT